MNCAYVSGRTLRATIRPAPHTAERRGPRCVAAPLVATTPIRQGTQNFCVYTNRCISINYTLERASHTAERRGSRCHPDFLHILICC